MQTETISRCLACRSDAIEIVDRDNGINRCRRCGYIFDSPRPTINELVTFYSRPNQYDEWLADEQLRDHLWRKRLTKLRRHSRPGNLLDIGTGVGQFLYHARPHFTSVTGTEVSRSAIRVAAEKYDLGLIEGQVDELNLTERFDNICMFHVLEHVPDPARTIRSCVDILAPSGRLFIAVPNDVQSAQQLIRRLLSRIGVKRFAAKGRLAIPRIRLDDTMTEIHLSHFTVRSLRFLLESTGLKVIHDSLDPYSVTRGLRGKADHALRVVSTGIHAVTRRNLYDAIWVVAERC